MLNFFIFLFIFLFLRELNKKGVFDSFKKQIIKIIRFLFTKDGILCLLLLLAIIAIIYIIMILILALPR